VKVEKQVNNTDFQLPAELDSLLDGIEVNEKLLTRRELNEIFYAAYLISL
jgi:hypothetical protein